MRVVLRINVNFVLMRTTLCVTRVKERVFGVKHAKNYVAKNVMRIFYIAGVKKGIKVNQDVLIARQFNIVIYKYVIVEKFSVTIVNAASVMPKLYRK